VWPCGPTFKSGLLQPPNAVVFGLHYAMFVLVTSLCLAFSAEDIEFGCFYRAMLAQSAVMRLHVVCPCDFHTWVEYFENNYTTE